MAPVEQEQLDDFLDENLRSQCICPSKSLMSSPVFFIKKRIGAFTSARTIESSM